MTDTLGSDGFLPGPGETDFFSNAVLPKMNGTGKPPHLPPGQPIPAEADPLGPLARRLTQAAFTPSALSAIRQGGGPMAEGSRVAPDGKTPSCFRWKDGRLVGGGFKGSYADRKPTSPTWIKQAEEYARQAGQELNWGILTKLHPTVDIDSECPAIVADLRQWAEIKFGPGIVRFRRNSAKIAIVYSDPTGSIETTALTWIEADGRSGGLDIKGAKGYLALLGIHKSGAELEIEDNGVPFDAEMTPRIDREQMAEFLAGVPEIIERHGGRMVRKGSARAVSTKDRGPRLPIGHPSHVAPGATPEDRLAKVAPLLDALAKLNINGGPWEKAENFFGIIASVAGALAEGFPKLPEIVERFAEPWEGQDWERVRGFWDECQRDGTESGWPDLQESHAIHCGRRDAPEADFTPVDFLEQAKTFDARQIDRHAFALDREREARPEDFAALADHWTGTGAITEQELAAVLDKTRPVLLADLIRTMPKPRDLVAGDWLQRGVASLLTGAPGLGKTQFLLQVGLAVAAGRSDVLDLEIRRPLNVLAFFGEDSIPEIARRVHGFQEEFGMDLGNLPGRLAIQSGVDRRFLIATKSGFTEQPGPDLPEMTRYIQDNETGLFIAGPLISLHRGFDENTAVDMNAVLTPLRELAAKTNCATVSDHHNVKDHSGDTERRAGDMNAARGSVAIPAAVRSMASLSAMNEKSARKLYGIDPEDAWRYVRFDTSKNNYGPRGGDVRWYESVSRTLDNADPERGIPADSVGVLVHRDLKPRKVAGVDKGHVPYVTAILEAMDGRARVPLADIWPAVAGKLGVTKQPVYDHARAAVPKDKDKPLPVPEGGLWRSREGAGRQAPIIIHLDSDFRPAEPGGDDE